MVKRFMAPGPWITRDLKECVLASDYDALAARLAAAERNEGTLLGMIRHQRDVLRECLPYLNESMAGRRPGRCADDIRAAVKALTADSASAVQPERCCLDYPRCDCNSPPEPAQEPKGCNHFPGQVNCEWCTEVPHE